MAEAEQAGTPEPSSRLRLAFAVAAAAALGAVVMVVVLAHDAKRIWKKLSTFSEGLKEVEKNLFVLAPLAVPFYGSPLARAAPVFSAPPNVNDDAGISTSSSA